MSGESLGLTEGVSIALGVMIGGGIFAVLGVVAQLTRGATWIAFVLAGIVALCSAYSFNAMNDLCDAQGGAVTFVQCFLDRSELAGMTGWTLLFGYVGSMAMYAYAFGSYTVGFGAVSDAAAGVPLRPVVSVLAVAAFVGLNLLGARAYRIDRERPRRGQSRGPPPSASAGSSTATTPVVSSSGPAGSSSFGPVMAAGLSFVAFQGWQLLFYDQEAFDEPVGTIGRAVYVSVVSAVVLYVFVAVTTVSLAPLDVIESHPERALAVATDPFIPYGFTIISVAALFSTGSAINATLFSAGYFTKGMLGDDLVPDHVGDAEATGVPRRTLLLLGTAVAGFTAIDSLGAITSFASLTFIVVFGAMSYLAFDQRHTGAVTPAIPALGVVGSAGFFALMLSHLVRAEPGTFGAVVVIGVAVVSVELLYFEREALERRVRSIEAVLAAEGRDLVT